MKCPKCKKGKMHMYVNFGIEIPAEDMFFVTKTKLRSKEYQILSADWDRVRNIFCTKCGYKDKMWI